MVATATKMPVRVIQEREPRGDIGPCCDSDCANRAGVILTLKVGGLIVTAWVCLDHYEALNG